MLFCACAIAASASLRTPRCEGAWCFPCEMDNTHPCTFHSHAQKYAELKRRQQLAAQQAAAQTQQQAGVAFAPLVRDTRFFPTGAAAAHAHAPKQTHNTSASLTPKKSPHTRTQADTRTAAQRIGLQK